MFVFFNLENKKLRKIFRKSAKYVFKKCYHAEKKGNTTWE